MAEVAAIAFDASAVRAYARYLKQAPEIARQEMEKAVEEALGFLTHELKDLDVYTPTGATEHLRGSIQSDLISAMRGQEVAGQIYAPVSYALPVELGTKPHWIGKEGIDSLTDWAKAKFGAGDKEARSIAFAVRAKIAVRGTKGAHMFERAFKDSDAKIQAMLSRAVERIAARLERGE
jgi:hypothetical protein